jgi:hypothetical protein
MSYRADITDKSQSELEAATFDGGSPTFVAGKTRVVAKGAQTATQATAHGRAAGGQRNNAGVVMPHDDVPNRFASDTQGKA